MADVIDPKNTVQQNWDIAMTLAPEAAQAGAHIQEVVDATAKGGVSKDEWDAAVAIKWKLSDELESAKKSATGIGGEMQIGRAEARFKAADALVNGLREAPKSAGFQVRRALGAIAAIKPRPARADDDIVRRMPG